MEIKNTKKMATIRIIILIIMVIITELLLPIGKIKKYSNLKIGLISSEDITAPYDFEIVKTDKELSSDREHIKENILPVFVYNDTINFSFYKRYKRYLQQVENISKLEKKLSKIKLELLEYKKNKTDSLTIKSYNLSIDKLTGQIEKKHITFQKEMKFKYDGSASHYFGDKKLKNKISEYLRKNLYKKRLSPEKETVFNNHLGKFILYSKNKRKNKNLADYEDIQQIKDDQNSFLMQFFQNSKNDTLTFWKSIINNFTPANIIYDKDRTQKEISESQNAIPLAKGLVKKGEALVIKNEIITGDIYDKIISLEKIEQERQLKVTPDSGMFKNLRIKYFGGKLLFVFIPYFVLFFVISIDRKSVFYSLKKYILLMVIIIIQQLLFYVFLRNLNSTTEYLVLLPVLSMLLAIFFDSRVAFIGTTITALHISMIAGNSFDYFLIPWFAGTISIYGMNKIRDRFRLFTKPFILLLFSYTLIAASTLLFSNDGYDQFILHITQGSITAVVAPFLTFGLVAIIEIAFKLPTDITLIELSDMTKPLLKKLQIEAPGTYHHSIVVGNLAEAAAEAVGANSLLARVGAYYHDIGKTFRPEYFIENQNARKGENKHDKLPPNMSALILSNHVKEGIKLAKEAKLPQILIDFISTHHGTSLMSFFYSKALKNAEGTDEKVEENIYRYPGPKPNSKETAIVMISDVVEARSRTVEKPDFDTYTQVVNETIQMKFKDGDLDNCDLKLNDFSKIRAAMVPVIMGMYHSRVKYPTIKKDDNKSKS